MMKFTIRFKGGKGSGHFGHSGRPGKEGGSSAGRGVGSALSSEMTVAVNYQFDKFKKNYSDATQSGDADTGIVFSSKSGKALIRQTISAEAIKKNHFPLVSGTKTEIFRGDKLVGSWEGLRSIPFLAMLKYSKGEVDFDWGADAAFGEYKLSIKSKR